jgi:hypothetical protein
MGINATRTYAELELSASAYDEIERKLLGAGYEHMFLRGPGSPIDMQGIAVIREALTASPLTTETADDKARQ